MTEHELTREESKALANDLYHCYLDLKDPGPNFGRSNEWYSLWVDKIIAFVEDQTAVIIAERDALRAENNVLKMSEALAGVIADSTKDTYIEKRSEMLHDQDDARWFTEATKESLRHELYCVLLNWSFCQDEYKVNRQTIADLTRQLAESQQHDEYCYQGWTAAMSQLTETETKLAEAKEQAVAWQHTADTTLGQCEAWAKTVSDLEAKLAASEQALKTMTEACDFWKRESLRM